MAVQLLTVVCAWCNRIVTTAPADAAVTHTICPACSAWSISHPASLAGYDATSEGGAWTLPTGYFGDIGTTT
jgi:hypothetical protein